MPSWVLMAQNRRQGVHRTVRIGEDRPMVRRRPRAVFGDLHPQQPQPGCGALGRPGARRQASAASNGNVTIQDGDPHGLMPDIPASESVGAYSPWEADARPSKAPGGMGKAPPALFKVRHLASLADKCAWKAPTETRKGFWRVVVSPAGRCHLQNSSTRACNAHRFGT